MRARFLPLLLLSILVAASSAAVSGEFLYTCDALPTASGWTVYGSSSYENGGSITSTIVNDGGSNTWRLVDSGSSRCSERNMELGDVSFNTGATIAANIRCAASSSTTSYNLGISNGNVGGMCLRIRSNQCALTSFTGTQVGGEHTFSSDTTNYHRYYLTVKNATQGDNGSATWNVYRDGALVISYIAAGGHDGYDGFYAGHYGGSSTGTWYFDWIAANNSGAFSPAQWDPTVPPSPPTIIYPADESTITIRTPNVQWTGAVHDAYEVHVNTTNNSGDADVWDSGIVSSAADSCVTGTLANGSYYIFARIHSSSGWSAWTAAGHNFTVDAPLYPPAAPTVTAPEQGATVTIKTPTILWTGDAHDGYEVHINTTNVATDADGWDSGAVTNAGDGCVAGNLTNGTYYVFARLFNINGWGDWSAAGRTFTVDVPPVLPGAPTIITPNADANVALRKVVVRWIGDPHDRYEVHINTTNNPTDADGWDSGQVANSGDWCDSDNLPNGAYYIFMRLRNTDGWGPWTDGRRFTVAYTGVDRKKGWVLLRDDQASNLELLSKAREYHVNHVQISHDIIMYQYEAIYDIPRRNRINELIDTAHANGVTEAVVWSHDIMTDYMPAQYWVGGKINLDDPGFWTWMAGEYETLFNVCPNLDGLVITFSECDIDFDNRNMVIHTGKSPIDTYEQAIATIWNVCRNRNKSLYIRTWGSDRWIRDALLRNDPAIWMMSKATGPADWNVIQDDYSIIGTATGHPELEEFDFAGEYWGLTTCPWAGIDYTKHLWTEFGLPRGVDGMVARIHRNSGGVDETPSRINMSALDILADYPDIDTDDIYAWWSNHWFGPTVGAKIGSAMKRSFDITNRAYNLPTVYPTSTYVANEDLYRSFFDLDSVGAALKSSANYQPGSTDYSVFHDRFLTAASRIGYSKPPTLIGNFSPTVTSTANPVCAVELVDSINGLNPTTFQVQYSTNAGSSWTNFTNFTTTSSGGSTDAYLITTGAIPFGQLRAANNKVRITATNLISGTYSKTFTARGLEDGYVTLGSSITSDGIYNLGGSDGDWVAASIGGRSCRTPATASDTYLYLQTDDGFAYDKWPKTIYLQVDYYGSSGSITPYYDSNDQTDRPLRPVYLSGGTGWRTATWQIDNVGFGHRLGLGADIRLYVGAANNVIYISGARLSYAPPAGMLAQPEAASLRAVSNSRVNIGWEPVAGATKYQVCRNGAAIGWPTGTSLADNGLTSNTQYCYTVTAFDNSNNNSCASANVWATTLSAPPTTSTVTSSPLAGTWQTSSNFAFTATGGFGAGKVAYYQYVWDESPTHAWTGNESMWPDVGRPSGSGWNSWTATTTPINEAPWLLYEGDVTQRLTYNELTLENGIPTWVYGDGGRVFGTKAKIGMYPNLNVNRDTGVTVSCRMKCLDMPIGWYNTGLNFGLHLLDCPDIGIRVRPDYVELAGVGQSVANGYTYHTYTLTAKNASPGNNTTCLYSLYRDGNLVTSVTRGPSGSGVWAGPFFGNWTSDATGGWAWQWIAWNTTGAFAPSPAPSTLNLTAAHYGSGYYLHLKGFNSDGVPNGTLDLGPYYYWNGSTPVTPTVTDDGAYTTSNAIHAKWSPVAPTASAYEYAIGTSPGASNIVGFTNVELSTEVTRTGLTLNEGGAYYVTVKGTVGSNTYTGSSNGITVAPRQDKIAEAKGLADNAPVALYGKTVSAVFADCAYIQETRGAGIRIVTTRPITPGATVDLAGKVSGSSGERALEADTVIETSGDPASTIMLRNDAIGGGPLLYNELAGEGQKAVSAYRWVQPTEHALVEMTGINTVGRLITTCGRVTWSDLNCFYIDDGTGYDDSAETGPTAPVGLKIAVPLGVTTPAVGTYAIITGVASTEASGSNLCRTLKARQQSDIR